MDTSDIKGEIVKAEIWSGFKSDPPIPFFAVQLTLEYPTGARAAQPWLALSPANAQLILDLLQTSLHGQTPLPPGTTVQ